MYNIKGDIGGELKKRREFLQITIEDVSNRLKVKAKDIALLEENSAHLITKHLYLSGLVRSYCKLLKLREEITQEYVSNITKDCNTKNKKHRLINLDADKIKNPRKEYLVNGSIIFIILYLLLLSFGPFAPYDASVTDLLVKQFEFVE